jgi:hypothetical protein
MISIRSNMYRCRHLHSKKKVWKKLIQFEKRFLINKKNNLLQPNIPLGMVIHAVKFTLENGRQIS